MNVGKSLINFSVKKPRVITAIMVISTLFIMLIALLPSISPDTFNMLSPIKVDTDPENMLSENEAVRLFHNKMKKEFAIYDIIVVGIVNEVHPEGVFNKESLAKVYELTKYAKTLRWDSPQDIPNQQLDNSNIPLNQVSLSSVQNKQVGVIDVDIISPSTVDNISQEGLGAIKFDWLMQSPPRTQEEALAIRENAKRIPFLNGTLLSEDGKAIALYIPISSKDISHKISTKLKEKIATFKGDEKFFITGLPVAEDTFGVEMFKQMAISAPIAMIIIFLLMLFFFKKPILIISPMIVAMVSVIWAMGLLIATGNTVHIMSSMIPIFIMPIAVLDAVHILSEFFDRYQKSKNREKAIIEVMDTLFKPMLYTSLTTSIGFASLILTPIPPVQVFGAFIAIGVMVAWVWSITFIPAFIMMMKEKSLANFGYSKSKSEGKSYLTRFLSWGGLRTSRYSKPILGIVLIIILFSGYGISKIILNDNPVKWFNPNHPIRIADKVLNKHFAGTYMAYLTLESKKKNESMAEYVNKLNNKIKHRSNQLSKKRPSVLPAFKIFQSQVNKLSQKTNSSEALIDKLDLFINSQIEKSNDKEIDAWDEVLLLLDIERQGDQVFKQPAVLNYMDKLQKDINKNDMVGKSNSLVDIVKTVHRELFLGKPNQFKIPETVNATAQTLITYQSSHNPQWLWHFVTPDYKKANIWIQLKSGDNQDMKKLIQSVDQYITTNPPPFNLQHKWFGLTYINMVWQEKMVWGMLEAFLGSFLVVFIIMIILFRSILWAAIAMIPLTVSIAIIYGAMGFLGKEYDMPVAVLSSLSLGLAIDFAIHFLVRTRNLYKEHKSWSLTLTHMFSEPSRAILRNAIVVGVGFLPLVLATLVPYQTVGVLISAILLTSSAATLIILPTLIKLFERKLFKI